MVIVAIVIVAACVTVAVVICTGITIPVAIVVIGSSIAIPVVICTGIAITVAIVVVGTSIAITVVIRAGITVAIVVVGTSVTIPVVIRTGIAITIVVIVPSISVVIGTREGVRILSHCVPKFWMILQIGLQLGMALHVRFIVDQLRILPKLLGDFAMAIKEPIEVDTLFMHALIFVPIITGFLVHESVWILLKLLANTRMLLHEGLQRRMIFDELVIIYERWILSNLFSNLSVGIEELIESGKFLASDVAVVSRLSILTLILILNRCGVKGGGNAERDQGRQHGRCRPALSVPISLCHKKSPYHAWTVDMSPAWRSARLVPKVLGESKRANDSVTWGYSSEAIQGSEVEIRHVGDKIVIRGT